MKVFSFGEVLWDVYPNKNCIGGAPLNFAAHLARHGEDVYMISAVGNDNLAKDTLDTIRTYGVNTDFISISGDKSTGRCLVTLDENSVPSYNLLSDVAYDYIDTKNVTAEADILYFGTLSLRGDYNLNSLNALLQRGNFDNVFVDINIRTPFFSEKTVLYCLKNATIIKISDEELNTVASIAEISKTDYKIFAKSLSEKFKNLKCIIITLGAEGSYAYDISGNNECVCPAVKTQVLSTVGAGDSFSASFLHKLSRGENLQSCLAYASKIAAFVVSKYEAIPDYKPEEI